MRQSCIGHYSMNSSHAFALGCFLLTVSSNSQAVLDNDLLVSPEALWIKSQNIPVSTRNAQIISDTSMFDIGFEPGYSQTLLEHGDLSVSRKILMNAAGTEFNPTTFQFDLHLELSYKFI